MRASSLEIHCPACGADSLLRREPLYDGLKKVGDKLFCASCRHEFSSEAEVPFTQGKRVQVFSDDDRPKKVDIFRGDEKGRNCRHCRHYVRNPFIQRCGKHHREVQATDLCSDFDPAPAETRKPELL
jgi:hypothetical protein